MSQHSNPLLKHPIRQCGVWRRGWRLKTTRRGEMLRISLGSTRIQFTTRHMHGTQSVKKGANTMPFTLKLALHHREGLIRYSTKAKNLEQAPDHPITTHPQSTKAQAQVIHTPTTAMSSHGRGETPAWKIPDSWTTPTSLLSKSERSRSRPAGTGAQERCRNTTGRWQAQTRQTMNSGAQPTHNK